MLQDVGWLRAETEEAYLGAENMTRIKVGRQKLGEVTRTNVQSFFPSILPHENFGKSRAFSLALNATRAGKVGLFFPRALCETSLNHIFFCLKLDEDEDDWHLKIP